MQEAILQAGVYFANTGSKGTRQKDYVLYVRLAYLDLAYYVHVACLDCVCSVHLGYLDLLLCLRILRMWILCMGFVTVVQLASAGCILSCQLASSNSSQHGRLTHQGSAASPQRIQRHSRRRWRASAPPLARPPSWHLLHSRPALLPALAQGR